MRSVDALVLGGGPAGLSFAYHWRRLRAGSCLVAEKLDRPGGLSGSVRTPEGFTFDYTGHLLHLHDRYGKRLVLDLLKDNVALHRRRSWIFSKGVFTRYPFQANTYGLPAKVVEACVAGALKVHRSPPRARRGWVSFRDFALETFGEGVCRHFMWPYNEKLWRTDLRRLGTEWQGRFIPKPSPEEVLYGALTDQKKFFGYNAAFRYPARGGSQATWDALAARVPGLVLGAEVERIDLRERVAAVKGLGEVRYRRLVNTMPLKQFLKRCGGLPNGVRAAGRRLRYTTVHNLNIGIGRANVSDKHWIYFPERSFPFYRAGFSSNFSRHLTPRGASSMYIETARRPGEKIDRVRLERACVEGLRRAGLLKASDRIVAKVWLPIECAYVVYDRARGPALAAILPWLSRAGVETIGRYGAWKYSFQEEALLDGKRCAERLSGRKVLTRRQAGELKPLE